MNTVIASQTSGSITARIKMLLNHPNFRDRVIVVVEGNDDKKIYSKMVDNEKVQIYPSGGCCHYKNLLSTLNPKFCSKLAVIKDADFDNIVGKDYDFQNLFRTDTHDAETMMMTDSFYEAFKFEFLDGDDEKLTEIQNVHDEIMPLSWLKLSCKELDRKVDFNFSVHQFYKGDSIVDINTCRQVLNKKPENVLAGIPTDYDIEVVKNKYRNVDKYNLNNGHDLCCGLAYKYERIKNKKIDIKSLEMILRTSFTMTQFKNTKLYSDMEAWASNEGLSLFKE